MFFAPSPARRTSHGFRDSGSSTLVCASGAPRRVVTQGVRGFGWLCVRGGTAVQRTQSADGCSPWSVATYFALLLFFPHSVRRHFPRAASAALCQTKTGRSRDGQRGRTARAVADVPVRISLERIWVNIFVGFCCGHII